MAWRLTPNELLDRQYELTLSLSETADLLSEMLWMPQVDEVFHQIRVCFECWWAVSSRSTSWLWEQVLLVVPIVVALLFKLACQFSTCVLEMVGPIFGRMILGVLWLLFILVSAWVALLCRCCCVCGCLYMSDRTVEFLHSKLEWAMTNCLQLFGLMCACIWRIFAGSLKRMCAFVRDAVPYVGAVFFSSDNVCILLCIHRIWCYACLFYIHLAVERVYASVLARFQDPPALVAAIGRYPVYDSCVCFACGVLHPERSLLLDAMLSMLCLSYV